MAGVPALPQLCRHQNHIAMATLFFAIVLLHLLAGFGYLAYRLTGSDAPKDNDTHHKQSGTAA